MPSYSKNDVVLVRYPFSDLTAVKVRPAVVVSEPHVSEDKVIVPLTSRTSALLPGEFVMADCLTLSRLRFLPPRCARQTCRGSGGGGTRVGLR